MFTKVVLFLIFGSLCVANVRSFNFTRDSCWPADLVSPFLYRTYSPINIDSATVSVITTPSPLKLTVGLYEPHNVVNTGDSVRVTVNYNVLTSVTGGVLGNDVYVFYDLIYFWAGDYSSTAGVKIDGVGSPLYVLARFRNVKYANAVIANGHRDGFAILAFNINVEGYIPNPLFDSYTPVLSSIVKSGSIAQSVSLPIFAWFDQLTFIQNYYSYPASFIDFTNRCYTQYDSATFIQLPKSLGTYISIPQFQYFQKLLTASGTPLVNILPTFPRGNRPVVQVNGIVQNFVPTAI